MVIFRSWVCILALFGQVTSLMAMQPVVRAEMHPSLPLIKGELQGTLSFYHSPDTSLAESTARMGHTLLPLVFLFNAPISAEDRALYPDAKNQDILSVYRFQLPFPEPGIHSLPSVAIKVGNRWIRSIPSSYQVTLKEVSPFLQLQAFVSPSLRLFPGQRARFVYRITYNSSMELTVEELPLIQAKGFERIGSQRIEEKELPHATMQEITQEVRTLQPGTFPFAESRIEGKRFVGTGHDKQYDPTPLQDSVPPITVQVLPFPQAGQPFFFTGGLAPLSLRALLLTKDSVRIGDLCKIAVDLRSSEETLETFSPPNLNCQAGFQGFFQIDPQVQLEQINDQTRRYVYYIRPLTSHINAVPSIEAAAFDPQKQTYIRARSLPLPLHIRSATAALSKAFIWNFPSPNPNGQWRMQFTTKQSEGVNKKQLQPWNASSSWNLSLSHLSLYTLLGCLLLLLQASLRPKFLKWRQSRKEPVSAELLGKREWIPAFMQKLYEEKWISSPHMTPESLSKEGIVGEVRRFLIQLQALKFGSHAVQEDSSLLEKQAHLLYTRMKRQS